MRDLQLELLLRLAISALIVVATALLGMGDHSAALTLLTLVMVSLSAWVCDFRKMFELSQPLANAAALCIMLVAAFNAYQSDRQGQLLVVAHLQSYLQYVLLFQAKSPRVYWQLALLSLGQVAIASTLIPGPIFGLMLVGYVFIGVVAFSLLVLHTDFQRWGAVRASHSPGAVRTVAVGAAGDRPVLLGNAAPSSPRDVLRGVLGIAAAVSLLAVFVTACMFFVLPRWPVQNREAASGEPLRTVGFSKTVTLGELGEIVNNSDLVMRVEFFRGRGNRRIKLVGEPLFRGTVVSEYEGGRWTEGEQQNSNPLPQNTSTDFVRQKITIEPLDVAELFCVFPVFAVQSDTKISIDSANEHLVRKEEFRTKPLEFEVGTTGIVGNRQRQLIPSYVRMFGTQGLLQMPQSRPGGRDPLAGLRAIAARVLEDRGIDAQDRIAAARALNDYLRTSGDYAYSLEAQSREAFLDPLEDFMTIHRQGHCEYFAGALVMMLRSQGIPARMAIGFKGGEWNEVGSYYQVQQLHAHTWVEVYLRREQIPPDEFDDEESPRGAWLVLDPTEGTREANETGEATTVVARFKQYLDYMQVLWANYVVGLNSKRQQQGVYEPLAQAAAATVDSVIGPEVWSARWQALSDSHLGAFWHWYRRHWFSWRGGLVAAMFSSAVILGYTGIRQLLRTLRLAGLMGRGRGKSEPPVLEMYRRLETTLARQGFVRQPAQTAYEFAVAAGGQLAEHNEHRRVAHLPRRVVEVFHRVRFGGRTLDNSEAQALEHALCELELVLGRSR